MDPLNRYTYSTVISSCDKSGHCEKAIEILNEMINTGLTPNVVCFNAAIKSCDKSDHWKSALDLMRQMEAQNVSADIITFNSAIS